MVNEVKDPIVAAYFRELGRQQYAAKFRPKVIPAPPTPEPKIQPVSYYYTDGPVPHVPDGLTFEKFLSLSDFIDHYWDAIWEGVQDGYSRSIGDSIFGTFFFSMFVAAIALVSTWSAFAVTVALHSNYPAIESYWYAAAALIGFLSLSQR